MAIKLSNFGGIFRLNQDPAPQLGGDLNTLDFNIINTVGDNVRISGLNYPAVDGIANQVLTTDGNGNITISNVLASSIIGLAPVATSGDFLDLTNRALGNISDVTLFEPADEEFLKFDGTGWVNSPLPEIAQTLNDLTDVDTETNTPVGAGLLLFDADSNLWQPSTTKVGSEIQTFYVSGKDGDDNLNNGTVYSPFASISRALDEIGEGPNAFDLLTNWVIQVAEGTYDEDIDIPKYRNIAFMARGLVYIGTEGSGNGNLRITHFDSSPLFRLITFSSEVNGLPTFTRSTVATQWTFRGDIIYDTEDQTGLIDQEGFHNLHLHGVNAQNIITVGDELPQTIGYYLFNAVISSMDFETCRLYRFNNSECRGNLIAGTYEQIDLAQFGGEVNFLQGQDDLQDRQPKAWLRTSPRGNITVGGLPVVLSQVADNAALVNKIQNIRKGRKGYGDALKIAADEGIPIDTKVVGFQILEMDGYTWNNLEYFGITNGITINGATPRELFDQGIIDVIDTNTIGRQADVDFSVEPVAGQVLKYDGDNWFADDEVGTSELVDGIFWDTPPTANKSLSNNGKQVNSQAPEWSNVVGQLDALEPFEDELIYFEYLVTSSDNNVEVGLFDTTTTVDFLTQPSDTLGYFSINFADNSWYLDGVLGGTFTAFTLDATASQTVQIAMNASSRELWVGIDDVYQGDPATATGPVVVLPDQPHNAFASPFSSNGSVLSPSENTFAPPTGFTEIKSIPQIRGRLSDLDDVNIVNPDDTQYLKYDDGQWVNTQVSYTQLVDKIGLGGLTDTVIFSPQDRQILRYNGTNWANEPFPEISTDLDSLTDVTLVSPSNGQYLTYNTITGQWENTTQFIPTAINDLIDVNTSGAINVNQVLLWDGVNWAPSNVDYDDVLDKPFIPTTINDLDDVDLTGINEEDILIYRSGTFVPEQGLQNDSFDLLGLGDTSNTVVNNGYLRWNSLGNNVIYQTIIPVGDIGGLSTVATTGSYDDLSDQPFIPSGLGTLTDVEVADRRDGDALKWDETSRTWIAGVDVDTDALAELTDTSIDGLAIGQTITWTGSVWTNSSYDYNNLSNLPAIPGNSDFNLIELSDTDNVSVANAYLRWNAVNDTVIYETTIPVDVVTGLSPVATSGSYDDLIDQPFIPENMNDLNDVISSSADSGQVLKWSGTAWTPQDDMNTDTITGLTDTSIAGQVTGQVLIWSGAAWENGSYDYGNLTNQPTIPVNGDFSFINLSDTNTPATELGYLRWNAAGTNVEYVLTIPASSITGLANVATSGNYNDLINQPFIPSTLNDLTNVTTGGITNNQVLTWTGLNWSNATVSYDNLSDTPDLSIYAETGNLPQVAIDGLFGSLVDIDLVTDAPTLGQTVLFNGTNWVPGLPTATIADLNDIGNVNTTGATEGQVLKWNAGASTWLPADDLVGGGGGGAENLGELGDVTLSGLQNRNYLIYDQPSALWRNLVPDWNDLENNPFGSTALIDELADVDTTTNPPEERDFLTWDGSNWAPGKTIQFAANRTVYAMLGGDDVTGNGTFDNPYGTLKKAVEQAHIFADADDDLVSVKVYPGYYEEENPIVISDWRVTVSTDTASASDIQALNPGPLLILSSQDAEFGSVIYGLNLYGVDTTAGNNGVEMDDNGVFYLDTVYIENCDACVTSTANVPALSQQLFWYDGDASISNYAVKTIHPNTFVSVADTEFTDCIVATLQADEGKIILRPSNINNTNTISGGARGAIAVNGTIEINTTPITNCDVATEIAGSGTLNINNVELASNRLDFVQSNTLGTGIAINSVFDITKVSFVDISKISITSALRTPSGQFSYTIFNEGKSVDLTGGTVQAAISPSTAPAYVFGSNDGTFVNVVDSGMYSPSARTIGLSTSGVGRLTVDPDGIVNITNELTIRGVPLATVATTGDYNDLSNAPFVPVSISDLSDVDSSGSTIGQVLKWDGGNWVAQDDDNSGSLSDLSDTNITGVAINNSLVWDGTEWVNKFISYDTLTNTPAIPTNNDFTFLGLLDTNNSPAANTYLKWNGTATEIVYQSTIPVADVTGLATVATSGSYNDLSDVPFSSPPVINDLVDVDTTTGINDGDLLVWDEASSKWVTNRQFTTVSHIIYVSTSGDDNVGTGEFNRPYASVAFAISEAIQIATEENPILVSIFPGVYREISPIVIDNPYISVSGESEEQTILIPTVSNSELFRLKSTSASSGQSISRMSILGDESVTLLADPITVNQNTSRLDKIRTVLDRYRKSRRSSLLAITENTNTGIIIDGHGEFKIDDVTFISLNVGFEGGEDTDGTGVGSFYQRLQCSGISMDSCNTAGISKGLWTVTGINGCKPLGCDRGLYATSDGYFNLVDYESNSNLIGLDADNFGWIFISGGSSIGTNSGDIGIRVNSGAYVRASYYEINNNTAIPIRQIDIDSLVVLQFSTLDSTNNDILNPSNVLLTYTDISNYSFIVGTGSLASETTQSGHYLASPSNATLPSHSFRNEQDKGMFSGGLGTLSFATNGLRRFDIEADGTLSVSTEIGQTYKDQVLNDNDVPNKAYVDEQVATIGGSVTSDLPSMQVRRTTTISGVSTSYFDFAWTIEDLNNATDVFELDAIDRSQINILESGRFQLLSRVRSNNGTIEQQLIKNGDTANPVPGSIVSAGEDTSSVNDVSNGTIALIVDLVAGDTLKLQIRAISASSNILSDANWVLVKLQGIKGEAGPAGNDAGDTLASIQTRIPAGAQLPPNPTFSPIQWGIVDGNTDPTSIELDSDGIHYNILKGALYEIHLHLSSAVSIGPQISDFRAVINDTTTIPGSTFISSSTSQTKLSAVTFTANLIEGSQVSFETKQDGFENLTITDDAMCFFTKQIGGKGDKGDKGDVGSGELIVQDEGIQLPGQFGIFNFTGPSVTVTNDGSSQGTQKVTIDVAASGSGGGGASGVFYADQLQSPNNNDWVVNNFASLTQDPSYNSFMTRAFDANTEEGVGFMSVVPETATNIDISIKGRANTPTTQGTVFKLYSREIPIGSSVPGWATAVSAINLAGTGNVNFGYWNFSIPLSTANLKTDTTYNFELTRDASNGNDQLPADFYMLELQVSFS